MSIGGCGADGMSSENAWDAGEESIYDPLYASEFAHLSMADIVELSSSVEVGEMVTCEPDWEPALARMCLAGTEGDAVGDERGVTAVEGELQEQPMLTVQPNLVRRGVFEFVVQVGFSEICDLQGSNQTTLSKPCAEVRIKSRE